jgi:hypothetical protein
MDNRKIGFAFLGFFCDFIRFFQATGPNKKETKNLLSTQTLERFESSHICPRDLHRGPYTVFGFTHVPSTVGASSPPARWGRRRQTSEGNLRFGSPGSDWRWWFDRRGTRQWPVAKQQRCLRSDANSGEMRGPTKPCVGVGAQVEAREERWAICGSRARAEHGSHRRRQWRAAADGVDVRARARRKKGGL